MKPIFTLLLGILCISCQDTLNSPYTNNVISSAHPLSSKAGKQMYALGGNAFDAAVAAGFTLAVVEPSMSGLGGRLQAIYHLKEGTIGGVDASTQVPKNYIPNNEKYAHGYTTIGIPGVVAGLLKLQQEHGLLTLEQVLQPAIEHAEKGFVLLPGEAFRQQNEQETLSKYEGTRHYFLTSENKTYPEGSLFIQKDLANTLRKIAKEGKAGFYEGEIAEKMVSDIQQNGGLLTLEDLKEYKALDSKVITGKFQNAQVYSLFLPSYGAITIQILQILDHFSPFNSEEEWATTLGKVTDFAYSYRQYQKNNDSLTNIISYDKAKEWAYQLQEENLQKVAYNEELPASWTAAMGHTTHLTTADKFGNIVSLTQTIGPNMGSKVATKGLGFLYAVTLGGYLGEYKPGDRSNSHISPTLFKKEGQVVLALGAAGGSRIVTAVTQVAHRILNQRKELNEALMLPRVYPVNDTIWIEDHEGIQHLNADLNPDMEPVKLINRKASFGRVHAISYDSINNKWLGAADPDWEGTVEIFKN